MNGFSWVDSLVHRSREDNKKIWGGLEALKGTSRPVVQCIFLIDLTIKIMEIVFVHLCRGVIRVSIISVLLFLWQEDSYGAFVF